MWHRHKLVPKEVKYPVIIRVKTSDSSEPYMEVERPGSAIFYKCACGEYRVVQMLGKREIWNEAIIEVEAK